MRRAQEAAAAAAAAGLPAYVPPAELTLTEKAAKVVVALRDQQGRGGMTVGELEKACGFDIAADNELMVSLRQNPKLGYESLANRFRYVAKYSAGDRYELLRLLRARGRDTGIEGAPELPGFPVDDLSDVFPGADKVIAELSRSAAEINVEPPLHYATASASSSSSSSASGFAGRGAGSAGGGGKDHYSNLPLLHQAGGVVRVRNVDTTKQDMLFSRDTPEE